MKHPFPEFIEANKGIIFKVCNLYCNNKEDREDLFQDIILNFWRSYSSFKGNSKVSTWMYRIALNVAITSVRKKAKAPLFAPLDDEAYRVTSTDDNDIEGQSVLMYKAIKQLSEIERAITMLYLENCTYKEISEVTGLSESNIGFKLNQN